MSEENSQIGKFKKPDGTKMDVNLANTANLQRLRGLGCTPVSKEAKAAWKDAGFAERSETDKAAEESA